jgi:CoA:oxalate CoA-transferase
MSGPLSGITVLDATRILSGPFCTMLLSDLGARVVKVESPGKGDMARRMGPFAGEDAAYFMSVNRGKESVTLNLFSERGQELFGRMAEQADVVVENYVPGTMERLGLGYAQLKKANPRLIYASISGFGQDGPYASRPALDIITQAMGGLMSVTGELDGPPLRTGASLGDSIAGLFAALAIVSAFHQRQQTGQGQYVDVAMLDCQVTMMENAFSRYFATGETPGRLGSRHPSACPFQDFAAADGDLVVGLLTDDLEPWRRFCMAVELEDLADDPRFGDNRARVTNQEALESLLAAQFAQQPVHYWLERMETASIPCAPVQTVDQVAVDPQIVHRGMIVEVPHPKLGTWRVANTPFRFSNASAGAQGPPPILGEHTEAVLHEWLGLRAEEFDALRESGSI